MSRKYKVTQIKSQTNYQKKSTEKIAIKKAIFPWSRFPAEDTMLGPEMKATGEVLGIGKGDTKKIAELRASQKALTYLNVS